LSSTFTAHNIRLDDGTWTMPSSGQTLESLAEYKSAMRALRLAFEGRLAGRRIADLGCLEGGYACSFARAGMEALGIEARASNYENCLKVKRGVDLANLSFVRDDVLNLAKYGEFDAIFCSGLLYHLDKPRAFLKLMSDLCRKVVIVNTHFATEAPLPNYPLSALVEHEGLPGRWYDDRPEGLAEAQLDALKWSSWSNAKSFWIQREYLIEELYKNGFDLVFEQYDLMAPEIAKGILSGYQKQHNRGLFVGVRTQ
jgi:Methyltransferase domain